MAGVRNCRVSIRELAARLDIRSVMVDRKVALDFIAFDGMNDFLFFASGSCLVVDSPLLGSGWTRPFCISSPCHIRPPK